MTNSSIIQRETDALFWGQTGYKPGQKLDPNNPTDKAYEAVWMDIFRKVKRAADAGTLVTTFDHPVVAQHLSDAAVSNAAAAAHLDAAVAAKDPNTSQENISAATTAAQISAQKTREAAVKQPQTVSPTLLKEAGKEAIKTPPPPTAPSGEHIAHGLAHVHAHGRHVIPQTHPPSNEALYKETNARFWRQTGYKPGQKLDRNNLQDREKAKIWMSIFRQVQHEAAMGSLVFTSPELTSQVPAPPIPRPPMSQPYPQMPPQYPAMPPFQQPYPQTVPFQYPQMQPFQQLYPQMPPFQGPFPQMPPFQQPSGHERGKPRHHRHEHGRGQPQQQGPTGPQPGGQAPPMDASAPQGGPSTPPSPSESAPSESMPSGPPMPDTTSPPPEGAPSIGKYLAIGLAIVAGGGLLYYATSNKSTRAAPTRMPMMRPLPRSLRDPAP